MTSCPSSSSRSASGVLAQQGQGGGRPGPDLAHPVLHAVPDAGEQPAREEPVQRRELHGHQGDVAQRHRGQADADAHPLGPRQGRPGRRDRGLLEAVLPQPELVEVPVGRRREGVQRLRWQGRDEHHAQRGGRGPGHGCLTSSTRKPLLEVSRVHGIASSVLDPALQAVRAEVALHDEVGHPAGGQPGQPGAQQLVERRLADPDRRVGPDQVEPQVVRDAVGGGRAHAVESQRLGVAAGEVERPLVDVERPHGGRRASAGPG